MLFRNRWIWQKSSHLLWPHMARSLKLKEGMSQYWEYWETPSVSQMDLGMCEKDSLSSVQVGKVALWKEASGPECCVCESHAGCLEEACVKEKGKPLQRHRNPCPLFPTLKENHKNLRGHFWQSQELLKKEDTFSSQPPFHFTSDPSFPILPYNCQVHQHSPGLVHGRDAIWQGEHQKCLKFLTWGRL